MPIGIVTDSTADLPPDIVTKYQIQVVPALLTIGDKTYLDGVGLSRDDFYRNLPHYPTPPTTSAPSISVFQQAYERLLQNGATEILSIHVASAFSSLHNIAVKAAEAYKNCVHVVDSETVTLGLGFQVIEAAEAAKRNTPIQEIINHIHSIREHVKIVALLDTLEYLRRSGRVGWATAAISNFLNFKVLIEVRMGEVHRLGLFRNREQGIEALTRQIKKLGQLEHLAMAYTQLTHPNEIQHILDAVKLSVKNTPLITQVTTVIGTHVGEDGLGFIAVSG